MGRAAIGARRRRTRIADGKELLAEQPLPEFVRSLPVLERREKRARVAANLARLEQDLWRGSLEFSSRPRIVDVQFSNFCNMACTMCYPHGNPPLQKLPEAVLEKLAREVFADASILVPFVGSEPLILTWDLARRLAEVYALELDVVTNVQFLDEKKFRELEPLVSSIRFSIDSTRRDVYERIRLKSRPDQVFKNLPVAARLCRDHQIEVQTNIVLMAENAGHVDETIAELADMGIPTFHLLQYHYSEPAGAASDPYQRLTPEEIEASFARIRAVAAKKRVRVVFDLKSKEVVDHRPAGLELRENPKNDPWIERFRRFFPAYCLQSVNRVKVNADGTVYPCCVADHDQLRLGNLRERSFAEIWNGPESRDLRRAMVTQDLPALCRDCSFTRGWTLPPQRWLPIVDAFARDHLHVTPEQLEVDESIVLVAPDHVTRDEAPPTLAWSHTGAPPSRWHVALALGGEPHEGAPAFELPGTTTRLAIPTDAWNRLRANFGVWWTLFAVDESGSQRRVRRAAQLRCLVRHQPIPRIAGSTLYGEASPIFHFSGTDTPAVR